MSSIDPFFGDGDNRDSDGEDFEEEAALLNLEVSRSRKTPAHAPKEQVTPWWCAMRNSFLKRCKKFQTAYGDDVVFGIEPVVPHYKNNSLSIGPVILGDPFAAVNQKSVLLEKVQKATNRKGKSLEERCWLVFVGESLARGGEVRYLNYDNWTFHQFTHVLDTQWTEMKTVNTYAMPFVPDKTHWTSDIYHALGSWFLVEDGLHRNMEEIEGRMQNVVSSLRKTGDSSTAKLSGNSEVSAGRFQNPKRHGDRKLGIDQLP
ncbi:hypothetical protein IV203_009727 [Nitzschia inconspicua]|uniref:Uncharacterized protein n=1 Tax=Nitzschia inconspicua TaxID=303405 RepID=A0A9K3PJT5_9STRA|nr:hypothetical protein IV203_009727 [Nitzschia inconspicua]